MNRAETAQLLTLCAAYDNRTLGDADVLAWAQVLGDLPYTDAQNAVTAHYATETRRIMPADVRAGVRRIRRDRLDHADATFVPSPHAIDNPRRYAEELRDHRRAIGDGTPPPAQPALVRAVRPAELDRVFRRA